MAPNGAISSSYHWVASFFTAIYLRSAYLVLSGNKVSWKGRQYRVNSHKTIEPQPTETTDELAVESMPLLKQPQNN